jgi:sporulation protein YlmC with PRC-barrel domain
MSWTKNVSLAGLLVAGLAFTAWAAHEEGKEGGKYSPVLQKGTDLLGMDVKNAKGDSLGNVDELVLNADHQQVAYCVVRHGGLLGIGAKYHAVPWQAFKLSGDSKYLVLDVAEDKWKNAPTFDKDKWPDMGDPNWYKDVHSYYGHEASFKEDVKEGAKDVKEGAKELGRDIKEGAEDVKDKVTGEEKGDFKDREGYKAEGYKGGYGKDWEGRHFWARRLSDVIGTDVKNRAGENLGELEDVMVDMHRGHVAYGILTYGGVLGIGEKWVAVPWAAFEMKPRLETARLDVDKKTLEELAFESDKWPTFDEAYGRRIHERFNEEPYWQVFGYPGVSDMKEKDRYAVWKPDSEYNKKFNAGNIVTIRGTVESIGKFYPEDGAAPGLRLRIKTDKGETYTVHCGPNNWVERQELKLYYGDDVTVVGSKTEAGVFGLREVLLATEVKKGDKTLTVRDKDGKPSWKAEDLY